MNRKAVENLINEVRPTRSDIADKLQALLDASPEKTDNFPVKADYKLRLAKFDGEYEPGKQPVEVIEREGAL